MTNNKVQLEPCTQCGFKFNCICKHIPNLTSNTHLALLLHPNELNRPTNTGKLVSQSISNCLSFTWDRVNPPHQLIELISNGQYEPILLFPTDNSVTINSQTINKSSKPPLFIILDSTWQEAKKMVRKSPWLASLICMQISSSGSSAYTLRRNQEHGNLCTCETAAALLSLSGERSNAAQLDELFHLYLAMYQADKRQQTLKH